MEEITEVEKFKKVFFPSGFDGTAAGFTVSSREQSSSSFLIFHVKYSSVARWRI